MGLFGFGKKKRQEKAAKSAAEPKVNDMKKEEPDSAASAPSVKVPKAPAEKKPEIASTKIKAEVKTDTKAAVKSTAKSAPKSTKLQDKVSEKINAKPEKSIVKAADGVTEKAPLQNSVTGKFEINRSKDGKKFFFNLYASNKVGIATSQMYSSAQSALNGVKSVIANAAKAPIEDQSLKKYEELPYPKWEIYVDNGGKFRFRLNASNGNCVCHSQGYTTKNACKNGIESIIRSSQNAEIEKTYISEK